MAQTNPSSKNTHNEDTQIDFKHIVPQWFERLNKLLFENVDADDFLWKYYSEINSYERCVLGEAYGYDSSYAVAGSKNRCQMCVELSGNFSFQIRVLDKKKIEMTINKFTIHWNEKHRNSGA